MQALLILVVAAAAATPDLRPSRDPRAPHVPRSLAMRAEPPPPAPAPAPAKVAKVATDARYAPIPLDLDELEKRVIFRFQAGSHVQQGNDYPLVSFPEGTRRTRFHTVGDIVVGTNGILQPSLSSYFAARFQFDQEGSPTGGAAVPTVYDGIDDAGAILVRSAYAHLEGIGPRWLRPLAIRAGRQFHFGPAIAHFDGATLAYETRPADLKLYYGRRVSLYEDPYNLVDTTPGILSGAIVRLRLGRVSVGGEVFNFEGERFLEGTLRWDPRPTMIVTTSFRSRAGRVARLRSGLRFRLSRVTTLFVELDDRREDWMYDYFLDGEIGDGEERFLRLGPVLDRLRVGARFGTVLFENLDLLLYGNAAVEHDDDEVSSFTPSWFEGGAAVEARFRHKLSAGVELRTRRYVRADPELADPFMDLGAWGERGFREAVLSIRYGVGARSFSSELSGFVRVYDLEPVPDQTDNDARSGGRFRVEAWALQRFRVLGEYELVVVRTPGEPDLEGLQSLRLIGEAAF